MAKRVVAGEQYFTAPDLARRCVDLVEATCGLDSFDLIVEPSAGAGAFFDLLPLERRIGVDIDPRHPGVLRADFLRWDPPRPARTLTIGNPPFGQRAALAFDFIEHAAEFSETIAFILPRSFNKYTFQNRVPRDFHLIDGFDCADFLAADGTVLSVGAVFQIWRRQESPRALIRPPDSHRDFELRHAHLSRVTNTQLAGLHADYEFTIPQVGADFRPRPARSVTRGSHWFVRPLAPGVRERFERLDFAFLDGMNTAHKSLSKRDIVRAYIETGVEPWA